MIKILLILVVIVCLVLFICFACFVKDAIDCHDFSWSFFKEYFFGKSSLQGGHEYDGSCDCESCRDYARHYHR